MTATDSATGHKTTTNYSQAHPYIGQVTATEQRQSNNTLISSVANSFQAHTARIEFAGAGGDLHR